MNSTNLLNESSESIENHNAIAIIFLQTFLIEKSALNYYRGLLEVSLDFTLNSVLRNIINTRIAHLQELQAKMNLKEFNADSLDGLPLNDLLEFVSIPSNLPESEKIELILQNSISLEQNILAFYNILEQECDTLSNEARIDEVKEILYRFQSVSFDDFLQTLFMLKKSLLSVEAVNSFAGGNLQNDIEKWVEILLQTQKNPEILKDILTQLEAAKAHFDTLKSMLSDLSSGEVSEEAIKKFLEKIDFSMMDGFIIGGICAMLSNNFTNNFTKKE